MKVMVGIILVGVLVLVGFKVKDEWEIHQVKEAVLAHEKEVKESRVAAECYVEGAKELDANDPEFTKKESELMEKCSNTTTAH